MSGTEASGAQRRRPSESTTTRKRLHSAVGRQRAEFLRRCRERIDPAELGLPQSRRKRTVGLRREDVAALSGVSVSWYTWLEQGRDMRVSDEVLERVCQALRLSEDERVYLFSLVQHRAPRTEPDLEQEAPPDIVRMIDALNVPAVAMNLRWDVLAWNRLYSRFYQDYSDIPPGQRNVFEQLLARPPVHQMSAVEFETMVRRLIARLRFDYTKHEGDPKFEALIRRLEQVSPLFRRIWRVSEFTLRAYGSYRFTHPIHGDLAFEHSSCVPDGHPEIRLVICMPESASARKAVTEANAELARSDANLAEAAAP